MKKLLLICAGAATAASMIACSQQNNGNGFVAQYAKAKAGSLSKGNTTTATCTPGQAGDISAGGVLLTTGTDGKTAALVDRVTANEAGGKSADGTATAATTTFKSLAAPVKETTDALDALASAKTYINLGCKTDTDLPTDIVKNWKEVKVAVPTTSTTTCTPTDITPSASVIYVCGTQSLSIPVLSLSADHMIFKQDATLALADAENSSLTIMVNTLTLSGNNSISVKTKDGSTSTAASLGITIVKSFEDQGKLSLNTNGASCATASQQKQIPKREGGFGTGRTAQAQNQSALQSDDF